MSGHKHRPAKAYSNAAFFNSRDARALRILEKMGSRLGCGWAMLQLLAGVKPHSGNR